MKKIFIIAGEPSGDIIGAKFMQAIKKHEIVTFYGVGGRMMEQEGLKSIFPIEKISLMGFVEIIAHIFRILKLINITVAKAKEIAPDIFISIDSPGFCFRVAAKLQNQGFKLIHYVAPSVWAYKPERATKVAKLYDYVISILPFEPPYFISKGVFCRFVGHPITEDPKGNAEIFRKKYNFTLQDNIVAVMPGSRVNEIKKLLPIFAESLVLLTKKIPNLNFVVIAFEPFSKKISEICAAKKLKVTIVSALDKVNALAAAKVALVKSGTSSLELAYNGVPMVVAYKVNMFSALLVKMMLRIPYVSLINILSGKEVVPEFLQNKCKATVIATSLENLLLNEELRTAQIQSFEKVFKQLRVTHEQPSDRAARIVLDLI